MRWIFIRYLVIKLITTVINLIVLEVSLYINSLSCSESNIDSGTADIVQININLDKSSLCILAIYRLHRFTVQAFTQELEHILYRVKDKNFLTIGDLNICILENTPVNFQYLAVLASFGLESLISTPTKITHELQSFTDHAFYRSRDELNCVSCRLDLGITYHLAFFCSIKTI